MHERVIQGPDCIAEGCAHLAAHHPRFAHALEQTGTVPTAYEKTGSNSFYPPSLAQQVSVAAARAILGRLKEAKLTGPRKIMWATEEELRACGLSRQKIRYAKALAEARIDFKALRDAPTPEIVNTLTQVSGIGVWTAEIYAMFSLGRADVFAPGDLALQESARILFDLPKRPTEREMRTMAEDWQPWRAVAARLLWAYYHVEKNREGIR